MARTAFAVILFLSPLHAADTAPRRVVHTVGREPGRYGRDARALATAPLHWNASQWVKLGEGAAAVPVVYTDDDYLYDAVKRHRSCTTDDFARAVTPFGGESFSADVSGAETRDAATTRRNRHATKDADAIGRSVSALGD